MRLKNRKKSAAAIKSMKVGTDELKDLIKGAVKEAMGEEDDTGDDGSDTAAALDGITAEDMADIIEQAVDSANEKRKSRKDAGEEVGDLTADEVIQEAAEIIDSMTADEGMDDDEADPEGKDDDEADSDEKDDDEAASEDDAKRRKSAAFRRQVKSGTAPAQRKYSSLFMGGTASAKKQQKSVPPLVNLARAIKCLDVFGRHDPERAEFYAKKYYNDTSMAREFKAMSATNPTAGGFLIPEVYLDEVIELLYSKTVIKELGARTIPLENGNLRLSAKRLEAIVPQTRELLMSTKYSADELFAADLSRRMQLGLDWGALYGTGGEFQPTGIANTPGVEKIDAKKMDAQYAADGKLTADFPVYVKSLVMSKNVDDQALGWAFNSFMEGYLKNIKTTTGDYIYRDEMNAGNFLGMPYKVSNQIPTDSKTGCTEMFFGNWADLMIGDQMGLETYTTLDGTWTDENGVQHNAFEENLTGTRALMYDDIGVRHVESFAYVHNIKVI